MPSFLSVGDMLTIFGAVVSLVWSAALIVGRLGALKNGQADLNSKVDTLLSSLGKMAERVSRIEGYHDARERHETYHPGD